MMTPEDYGKKKNEFYAKLSELEEKKKLLRKEFNEMTDAYIKEVFEKSGHYIGEKIVEEGKTWYVSGARVLQNGVVLSFNSAKKDGTMSKVTFIARGEPFIWLN